MSGSTFQDPTTGKWGFVVDVASPDGRRRQVKRRNVGSKAEAGRAMAKVVTEAGTGRALRPSRMTFGAFLTGRWLPALAADTKLKPSTREGYRQMARHLVDGLGAVRLDELDGGHLSALYGRLREQGLSERTVRYVHVTARKALGAAVRWRLMSWNPAEDADAPAQSRPDPKAWSPEQVGRFLGVAEGDRWWPLWRLAATTGMRRGELAGLRWGDVDLSSGRLVVARNVTVVAHRMVEGTPKSDRSRAVGLDPATVSVLKQWRQQQREERVAMGGPWPEGDRVFLWPDGSALHPNVITRTFRRLTDEAGLPPLPLHNLRHAWATSALLAGIDVKVVSGRLGHSSTRVTHDIYTAALPSLDDAAAATVAGLYDRGRITGAGFPPPGPLDPSATA